ncbi:MAG: SsrA-binding protein SmpB [Actinobacteria bacterium ATB1]|nr:SsrA-binding protein SmpB [Actinobacteria bacterium ATB1]
MSGESGGDKVVARNRKARHDYEILETYEAGIVLTGSEVKSLRAGRANLQEAYARPQGDAIWLHGMHISPYSFARDGGHEPTRPRKLLLHRREVDELTRQVKEAGLTIVPLSVVFRHGLAKAEIGLARGKKLHDKRQSKARADAEREIQRSLSRRR